MPQLPEQDRPVARRAPKAHRLAFVAPLAVFLVCGTSPDDHTGNAISRISVTPARVELQSGESARLVATAYAPGGESVEAGPMVWRSSDETVATVSTTGDVTAMGVGTATITASFGTVDGQAEVTVLPTPPTGAVVQVWPSVTHQVMTGWEAVTQIGQTECDPTAFAKYRLPLLDAAVNDFGINRVRFQVNSGTENPVDWFALQRDGQVTRAEARPHWYEIINDNADPFVTNPAGFQWSRIDNTIDEVVNPLRQRLMARGEELYVNLTYVDFAPGTFEHSSNPEEYAELILNVFQHLQSRYGWVPNAVEMILEPDNTNNWRPNTIGAAIVATGDRLAAAGFRPAFIAPSNTNMTRAVEYFDQLVKIPRVMEYLTDFAYHRYGGVSAAMLQAIGDRAVSHGVRTGMLEWIGASYRELHDDIATGRASSWEQFTLAFCEVDNGAQYYTVNQSNPSNPVVALGSRSKFLRQYFRDVRLNAVRIGAASGDARFNPLAFRNTDGRHVVVLKATSGGSVEVRGLPMGTYGRYYTTDSQFDVRLPDVTISSGQGIPAPIPAAGVLTIHRR
jgi:hypothetical protein